MDMAVAADLDQIHVPSALNASDMSLHSHFTCKNDMDSFIETLATKLYPYRHFEAATGSGGHT
jgi:hypothetical protein